METWINVTNLIILFTVNLSINIIKYLTNQLVSWEKEVWKISSKPKQLLIMPDSVGKKNTDGSRGGCQSDGEWTCFWQALMSNNTTRKPFSSILNWLIFFNLPPVLNLIPLLQLYLIKWGKEFCFEVWWIWKCIFQYILGKGCVCFMSNLNANHS